MPGAASGSSAMSPLKPCPFCTVSRLVPSWAISASSPAWEEADRPSTATIAATPIAIPSADRPARSLRVRRPTLASRARSAGRSRAAAGAAVRRRRSWGSSVPGTSRGGRGARSRACSGCPPAELVVSAVMRPSSMWIWRGRRAAMAWLWVTTTMVVPAAFSSASRARMEAPVAESRLPVGSSASTIAGWPATARAIATRCRSPPDSWVGRAASLWPSPTRSSAAAARRRRSASG